MAAPARSDSGGSISDPIEAALAVYVGDAAAEAFSIKLDRYDHLPGVVKGVGKMPSDPSLELACLSVVDDPAMAADLGFDIEASSWWLWGLLPLAARADSAVVDRVEPRVRIPADCSHLTRAIRRNAATHAKNVANPPAPAVIPTVGPGAVTAPQKISEVKGWLAANKNADPAVLAPYPKQKAAARLAAIRILGSLGTPAALSVLGQYASASHPDAVLDELHKAWNNFDRRDFAKAVFLPNSYLLDLGLAPNLDGIDAVPNLTGLRVVLPGNADLSPLAGCLALRQLVLLPNYEPGLSDLLPLVLLPALTSLSLHGMTREADLTVLSRLSVQQLSISLDGAEGDFLLDMPALTKVSILASPFEFDNWKERDIERDRLAAVALELVDKGVAVNVWKNDGPWVETVLARAEADPDLYVIWDGPIAAVSNDPEAADPANRYKFRIHP